MYLALFTRQILYVFLERLVSLKHRQLTKCPNEWDSEEVLGATGQNMAQNWLCTSPKESGQYTFLIYERWSSHSSDWVAFRPFKFEVIRGDAVKVLWQWLQVDAPDVKCAILMRKTIILWTSLMIRIKFVLKMRQQVGFWVYKLVIVEIWQLHPCVQTFGEHVLKSRQEKLEREESVDMGNGASDLATLRRIIQPSVDIITPACLMASLFSLRWRLVMNAIVVFEFVIIWRNFLF